MQSVKSLVAALPVLMLGQGHEPVQVGVVMQPCTETSISMFRLHTSAHTQARSENVVSNICLKMLLPNLPKVQ